jgi:predicted Zn-dependent protease
LLANTYWEGDEEYSMWDFQFPDGSFARFTVLPVNLWVGAYGNVQMNAAYDAAIDNALNEIRQVVPIQRVQNRAFAHITMWLMTDDEFNRNAACSYVDMTVGCTSPMFTDVGILLNSVWLRVTDECFPDTVLHELTHAIGILVHSPYPDDIMYFMETCGGPHYTQRDLNTLRALYAAPPYDPRRPH